MASINTTLAENITMAAFLPQEQTGVELDKYTRATASDLTSLVRMHCAKALTEIQDAIDARPFNVVFEPRLGAPDAQLSGPRSVLPIFRANLFQTLKQTEINIIERIEPHIRELSRKREDLLIGSMKQNQQMRRNATEEGSQMRKQIELLEIGLVELRKQKNEQHGQFRKEILTLREQLNVKGRVGGVYKPDFTGVQIDGDMVTHKFLQEQLSEQQKAFDDERKVIEKKFKAQMATVQLQLQNSQNSEDHLKNEVEQLQQVIQTKVIEYEQLRQHSDVLLSQTKDQSQQEIDRLQEQLDEDHADFDQKMKTLSGKNIALESKLEQVTQGFTNQAKEIQRLKAEVIELKETIANNLEKYQKQLQTAKSDDRFASQLRELGNQLDAYKERNDALTLQVQSLRGARDDLEADLKSQKKLTELSSEQEFAQLLMKVKKEFQMCKQYVKSTFRSLFDESTGGLTRFVNGSLSGEDIYQQLLTDVVDSREISMQYFENEMNLVQSWLVKHARAGSSFRPQSQMDMQLSERDSISKRSDDDKPAVDVKRKLNNTQQIAPDQEEKKPEYITQQKRAGSGRKSGFESARPRSGKSAGKQLEDELDEDLDAVEDIEYIYKADPNVAPKQSIVSESDHPVRVHSATCPHCHSQLEEELPSRPRTRTPPRPRQVTSAKPTTNFEMTGVFHRLEESAKEIEMRAKRKRDLLVEERMRTQERVLKAMSLVVDRTAEGEQPIYAVSPSKNKLMTVQPARVDTARNSAQNGSKKPPLKAAGPRPESAQIQQRAPEERKRPNSGRAESVLQLLAASQQFAAKK